MREVVDYKILVSTSTKELERLIVEALKEGWFLYGDTHFGKYKCFQTIVKYSLSY